MSIADAPFDVHRLGRSPRHAGPTLTSALGKAVDAIEVAFDESTEDNAVLLLAAAEELGLDVHVVRTSEGAFFVPEEVYHKAFDARPGEFDEKPPVKRKTRSTSGKAR